MTLVSEYWRIICLVHSDIYINEVFPLMYDSNIRIPLFYLEPGSSESVEGILENTCTFRVYAERLPLVPDGVSAKQTNNKVGFMRTVLVVCQW